MNKYQVKSGDQIMTIYADSVSWSGSGLTLTENDKIIGVFTSWEFWVQCFNDKEKVDET